MQIVEVWRATSYLANETPRSESDALRRCARRSPALRQPLQERRDVDGLVGLLGPRRSFFPRRARCRL